MCKDIQFRGGEESLLGATKKGKKKKVRKIHRKMHKGDIVRIL
jgi:hypothetical protein|tara:strand:+ start:159 stop:287 length:129 start_codon:yes stop_codon:yes gene_type:complete